MEQRLVYTPQGVCSQKMEIVYDDQSRTILSLVVTGGCNGNLKGISRLLVGMPIDHVIERFEGTKCGFKQTSCPDQIARALKQIK